MATNLGNIYPGVQTGTATLTAGSVAVTFSPAFKKTPEVWVRLNGAQGTALTFVDAAGESATGFTATSQELLSISGGTTLAFSGTVAVSSIQWLAFVDN